MHTARNAARKNSRTSRKSAPQPHPQSTLPNPGDPCSAADPRLYINRELSLLAFQKRVLEEAEDPHNPLLERVKFLSIFGSNLEEFFMVRVAGLKRQVESGVLECAPAGLPPKQQLDAIHEEVSKLLQAAQNHLRQQILPALQEAGLCIVDYAQLTSEQREGVDKYFIESVFPALTPLAFDPGRPFPLISNLSLNLAVLLRAGKGAEHFARVKVPETLPQLVSVTSTTGEAANRKKKKPAPKYMVWLEQLIAANLQSLFPGMEILEAYPFHVTRDADNAIKELEAGDLMESVEEGVWQRRFADVIRLEVDDRIPAGILQILQQNLALEP